MKVAPISLLVCLALAVPVALATDREPAQRADAGKVCAAIYDFADKCQVKPDKLGVGAKGAVKRIHWRDWGAKRAIGFGRLTVAGFQGNPNSGIGPTKGRLKFDGLVKCGGDRQYAELTIKYGHNFDKTYVKRATWAPC